MLDLSAAQQVQLQVNYKSRYEAMVRRAIQIPLHQYEFDALVSYASNPGTRAGWQTTTRLVNERKPREAMETVKQYVFPGKTRMRGLVDRRDGEARLFLYGESVMRFAFLPLLLATAACDPGLPAATNVAAADAALTAPATPTDRTPSASDAPATQGRQSDADINANAASALRESLLAACATSAGATPIRWGEMGNIAARPDSDRQTLRLPAEAPDGHVLSMPQGESGDGIVSGTGLLVLNCEGG